MKEQRIRAEDCRRMFCAAADALRGKKEEVNALNVFPVPDGDTGTNMFLTLDAVRAVPAEGRSLAEYAAGSARAAMRAARGNSGVILSLFFRGLAEAFAGREETDAAGLVRAFRLGSESARKAVMKPVEGTILTVMRECAAFEPAPGQTADEALERMLALAEATLRRTPELLPTLKKAGVVDSGGFGFVTVVGGMLRGLTGAAPETADFVRSPAAARPRDETEEIRFAFCTEALTERSPAATEEVLDGVRAFLDGIGDSVVLAAESDFVKVHVHTNEPMTVLERLLRLGTPQFIKVENMRAQHSALISGAAPETREAAEEPEEGCGIVAAVSGEGLRELFLELGADRVVAGGQSMNPSAEEFLSAIRSLNRRRVLLLPNNSNVVLAARQAAALAEGVEAEVVDAVTIPQGIAALLAFRRDADTEENAAAMREALAGVKTFAVTRAVRNAETDDVSVRVKQYVGLREHRIRCAKDSLSECLLSLAGEMRESRTVTLYCGADVDREEAETSAELLRRALGPETEVSAVSGDQPVYRYLIGAE